MPDDRVFRTCCPVELPAGSRGVGQVASSRYGAATANNGSSRVIASEVA
jgi:hypothetical protein